MFSPQERAMLKKIGKLIAKNVDRIAFVNKKILETKGDEKQKYLNVLVQLKKRHKMLHALSLKFNAVDLGFSYEY